jgi:hypothetical protein
MCGIASLFLSQRLKGNMSDDARDFNNIETRALVKFFFYLQDKSPKEIHTILTKTLGEDAPSYATVKHRVAQVIVVIFPLVLPLVLDDPKQ